MLLKDFTGLLKETFIDVILLGLLLNIVNAPYQNNNRTPATLRLGLGNNEIAPMGMRA